MIRRALFLFLLQCGGRIEGDVDASSTDGGGDASKTHDASTQSDGGSTISDAAAVVTCGPNTCHAGEICCNEKCGVCTFPDECVVHDCGGP